MEDSPQEEEVWEEYHDAKMDTLLEDRGASTLEVLEDITQVGHRQQVVGVLESPGSLGVEIVG